MVAVAVAVGVAAAVAVGVAVGVAVAVVVAVAVAVAVVVGVGVAVGVAVAVVVAVGVGVVVGVAVAMNSSERIEEKLTQLEKQNNECCCTNVIYDDEFAWIVKLARLQSEVIAKQRKALHYCMEHTDTYTKSIKAKNTLIESEKMLQDLE